MKFISYKPKSKEYILLKENKQKYATDLQTLLEQPQNHPQKNAVCNNSDDSDNSTKKHNEDMYILKVKLNNY